MTLNDTLLEDGRALILAYDHGLEHGPSDLLGNPGEDPEHIFELAEHDAVTALAVQKGLAERYYAGRGRDVSLLLKCNGIGIYDGEPDTARTCSVEHALDIGADVVGFTHYAGSEYEAGLTEQWAAFQEEARDAGVPTVMWAYPRGAYVDDDQDPDVIGHGARIALELGADMAKVKYPGEDRIEDVVQLAGEMALVMSGGATVGPEEFLEVVDTVMEGGFTGIAVGRNVWQRDDPGTYLDALGRVIHDRDLEAAKEVLEG